MSSDLDIVKDIEHRTGIVLKELTQQDLLRISTTRGFIPDSDGQIESLRLDSTLLLDLSILTKLSRLSHLILRNSYIPDYDFLRDLKNLSRLHLSLNKISDISFLNDLKNLSQLTLSSNEISGISGLKVNNFFLYLRIYFRSSIYRFRIKSLMFPVLKISKLTRLYLRSNKVSDVSDLKELKNLSKLYLRSNKISDVSGLKGLGNLTRLYLHSNRIFDVSFLKNTDNITQLDLSGNKITDFSYLKNVKNLVRLDLSGNKISDVSLLDLSSNQISDVSFLKDLKNLSQLFLSNNKIVTLPSTIVDLNMEITLKQRYGKFILLKDNPLKSPPIEIVEQGKEAVKNYFSTVATEETSQVFEAKLLIVGQGGVGKTWLMQRLIYDKIDPATVSTEGIEISHWLVETAKSNEFQINFWDFGGQEIYHATHQFFLTKRSLYLFVWEARTDSDLISFDYWLNTVKVLSDNSPVLVIQNKIDERKKPINEANWKTRFSNIVRFLDVSAKEDIDLDDLKRTIAREIDKLPHIGDTLPKSWIDVRQKLESLNENYISYGDYAAICREYNLDEKQAAHLSNYYHDLGVFLHFRDNPILRNTVFLDTQWATNAVYKITANLNLMTSVKSGRTKNCFRRKSISTWSN